MTDHHPNAATDPWERHAKWWQEGFTDGADPEYVETIIPLIEHLLGDRARVLDIGAGEGQLVRAVAAAGASLTVGLDLVAAQVAEAVTRGGGPRYVQAGALALPFGSASFDGAIASLVFDHIEDLDTAISEVARALEPGGRFVLLMNHPLVQTPGSGWIDDHVLDPPEQYWRVGRYLVEVTTMEEVEKGIVLPFVHRPLSRYVNALAEHGLSIIRMVEPAPPPGFLAKAPEYTDAATIPRLMILVCEKVGTFGP